MKLDLEKEIEDVKKVEEEKALKTNMENKEKMVEFSKFIIDSHRLLANSARNPTLDLFYLNSVGSDWYFSHKLIAGCCCLRSLVSSLWATRLTLRYSIC